MTTATFTAEHALLGAAMFDPAVMERCEDVRPEHFAEPLHGRIWGLISERARDGRSSDPTLLAGALAGDPAFGEVGGLGFLADLMDKAPPATVIGDFAKDVREQAMRRALAAFGRDVVRSAENPGPAFDQLAHAERTLSSLLNEAAPSSNAIMDARSSAMVTVDQMEDEARNGRPKGALTGLRCFDRRLRGLRPGNLVILGGRPSMGKTALARAAAFGCARNNPDRLVPFFCLEMDRREIDERSLAQLSHEVGLGIPYLEMDGDSLPPEDRDLLRRLAAKVPDNLLLDDSPVLSVDYVRRRVLALRKRAPIAAVFIDYLQIMERPPSDNGRNDAGLLGQMTKALKQLAREAHTCVVVLSQLSRQVEQRDDKRPQLSDLRESGAIEQDANAVLFAYREAYYSERQGPRRNESGEDFAMRQAEVYRLMEVICAKQRRGPVGTDRQTYFAEFDVVIDEAGT